MEEFTAVKSGLFTRHEMGVVVKNYGSNLEEVFWVLQNLKSDTRINKLIGIKYGFIAKHVFLKVDDLISVHVFQKIMILLEIAISKPEKAMAGNLFKSGARIGFADLFVSKTTCKKVISSLVEYGFIRVDEKGYDWINKGRNAGIEVTGLFNYLIRKNALKIDFRTNFLLISEIMSIEFGIKRGARTYQRMNDANQRKRWKDFAFIGL